MKLLFGSFSAITTLGGGVEVQVRALARVLTQLGVEVELFSPWQKYTLSEYDLFHLFGAHLGTYHLGRAIKNLGMKMVLTPVFYSHHRVWRVKTTSALVLKLRRFGGVWTEPSICKELCCLADLILANTTDELKLIAQGLTIRKEKLGLVPNGVDERFYYATPELFVQQYGIKDFVLYVGHIGWGRKNLLPLLRVIKKIRVPAVLIGPILNNEYTKQCQKIISDTPFIKIIPGLQPESKLLESAYAACDTFILPSLYETPGLSALEAGLAGAKICITKYGGTKEYFGDYATYLEPKSEKSIEQALKEALSKPKSSLLKEHIKSKFLWENCGKRLLECYHRFLEGRVTNPYL